MFTIQSDGSIQTDSIDDALALAARMRERRVIEADINAAVAHIQSFAPPAPRSHLARPPSKPAPKKSTKPAAPMKTGNRPRGTGSVYNNGSSWSYVIGKRPNRITKSGHATREEATAALDAHLRGEKPAPMVDSLSEIDGFDAPADEPILASNLAFIHPGEGFGPVDDNGLSKCLRCDGRGTLKGGPKRRGADCTRCNREGVKRCEPRKLIKRDGFASSFPFQP